MRHAVNGEVHKMTAHTLNPAFFTKSRQQGRKRLYISLISSLFSEVKVLGRLLSHDFIRGSQPSMCGSM